MLLFFDVLFLKLLLLANFYVLFAKSRWLFYSFAMFGLVYRWGSSMLTRPTHFLSKTTNLLLFGESFTKILCKKSLFFYLTKRWGTELRQLQVSNFAFLFFVFRHN